MFTFFSELLPSFVFDVFCMYSWTGGNSKIDKNKWRAVPKHRFLKMKRKCPRSGFQALLRQFLDQFGSKYGLLVKKGCQKTDRKKNTLK